jgi:hypothetical protein
MEVGGQRQNPVPLLPKWALISIVEEAGWAPGLVWKSTE